MQVLSKRERDTLEKIYGGLPPVTVNGKEKLFSRKQLMFLFTNIMYLQMLSIVRREDLPIPFIGDMIGVKDGVMSIKLSPLFERNLQRFESELSYDAEEMILNEIMSVMEKQVHL